MPGLILGGLTFFDMKANEVRQGNWLINFLGEEFQASSGTIAALEGGINEFNLPTPIPLTPQILEKCGFVVVNHIHGYSFYTLERRRNKGLPPIDIYDNKTLYYNYPVNHCKYLHQLQNLFYTVTGEELTYTP